MLWNLLTAGIFGADYYIKKKINASDRKDMKSWDDAWYIERQR